MTANKDSTYYRNRLKARAQARYEELTAGKTVQDLMLLEEQLEAETFLPALEARIAQRLGEARGLVDALPDAGDAAIDVLYLKSFPLREKGQMEMARLNRSEIIGRLEEISGETFGGDAEEWRQWLEAWEKLDPPTGYR